MCRVGRKTLFWVGGAQMLLAQIATTVLMAVTFMEGTTQIYSIILIEVFVCMFTSGFAYSWGPLGWLVRCQSSFISLINLSTLDRDGCDCQCMR